MACCSAPFIPPPFSRFWLLGWSAKAWQVIARLLDPKGTQIVSNLAFKAMAFAREVHAKQRRKYTNNPYADHLAEVAGIVSTVSNSQRPGHKADWAISGSKQPMTADDFALVGY